MQLKRLTPHFVLTAAHAASDIPERIEVLNETGTHLASYARVNIHDACRKAMGGYRDRFMDVIEIEEWPEILTVAERSFPEKIGFEFPLDDTCRYHGWNCSLWIREVLFRLN